MIWLEELTNRKKISKIFNIYAETFPEEERRNKEQFLDLSENPNVYIFSIRNDEISIGYCIFWQLTDFYFLEHFEVFQEFRNQNFGSEILKNLKEKFEKIVLESEPEHLNETAKRRISFYKKNGFIVIDETYVQPSYGDGKPSVNLWLLANFITVNLQEILKKIKNTVYEKS